MNKNYLLLLLFVLMMPLQMSAKIKSASDFFNTKKWKSRTKRNKAFSTVSKGSTKTVGDIKKGGDQAVVDADNALSRDTVVARLNQGGNAMVIDPASQASNGIVNAGTGTVSDYNSTINAV